MKTIWKYQIYGQGYSYTIDSIVAGAIPIHVGMQDRNVFIWFQVETNNPPSQKTIHIRGTGQSFNGEEGAYIGTIQKPNGSVWHYFDERPTFDDSYTHTTIEEVLAGGGVPLYTEN